MKKFITLALCAGFIGLAIWSYNINAHNTKATSSEVRSIIYLNPIEKKMQEMFPVEKVNKESDKPANINNININIEPRMVKVSRSKEEPELIPITVVATSYAPYDNKSGICNDGEADHTSTGTKPDWGTIAADPKRLPYGTKLIIPNYNNGEICTVLDTGGALRRDKKNIRIDLYMDTYEQAMNWGRQEITVYIVK